MFQMLRYAGGECAVMHCTICSEVMLLYNDVVAYIHVPKYMFLQTLCGPGQPGVRFSPNVPYCRMEIVE